MQSNKEDKSVKKDNNPGKRITLDLPPVGIKILSKSITGYNGLTEYKGISYCNAVTKSADGMELLIRPGSITVCQWAPVVLGLKAAGNDFERSINRHLSLPVKGIYMAPVHLFRKNTSPDVVIVRTSQDNLGEIIRVLGWENFIDPEEYHLNLTALNSFKMNPPKGISGWLIQHVNSWLSRLNRFNSWQSFTTFIFKSTFVTHIFDRFISRYMSDMSMCRNSTVVPYQTGRANISYFCTGGIAWGKNIAEHMTSGFPYKLFKKLEPYLAHTGDEPVRTR